MIDFGLYCEIAGYLEKAGRLARSGAPAGPRMQYFAEERDGETAMRSLIQGCDRETVVSLMDYFGPEASVQELLRRRLAELTGQPFPAGRETFSEKVPSFYQYLSGMIEKHGFKSEADFYKHISMSRQTFAKLRCPGCTVSRDHVLLMAVGLELDYHEAVEFMRKAGYAFRSNDRREAIILYVIRNQKYTLDLMEDILCSFGQKPLIDY